MPNHFIFTVFCCERRELSYSHSNGDLFTCEDSLLFSHVKVSCFCAKAHLVFHWCLYNKVALDDGVILMKALTLISSIFTSGGPDKCLSVFKREVATQTKAKRNKRGHILSIKQHVLNSVINIHVILDLNLIQYLNF